MIFSGTKPDYDIVIIGGGLVGASMAAAFAGTSVRVAMVEARPAGSKNQPSYDDRTTTLAYSSKCIFEAMGVWSQVDQDEVCPIRNIHISDQGHFGLTHLSAKESGLEALGYVVVNRILGKALYSRLHQAENIEIVSPAQVRDVCIGTTDAQCVIEQDRKQRTISAKLFVLADGGRSGLRESLGIQLEQTSYRQTAITAHVTPESFHEYTAYERFTRTGPLAVVPLSGKRCGIVWTTEDENVEQITSLSDEVFLEQLGDRFGYRLGKFVKVGKRNAYSLSLSRARDHVRQRLVLIGNAAHGVHPVAGQGFNLGLRDVATLAQIVVEAIGKGENIGELTVLNRYVDWRRRDNYMVPAFTHSLIRLFSNDFQPLVLARNVGLMGVDLFPFIKRRFTKRTSGLHGRLPRLAMGESLTG